MYVALGCVFDCAIIACTLRWGVALIGNYHYWTLLTLLWDPLSGTGGVEGDSASTRP